MSNKTQISIFGAGSVIKHARKLCRVNGSELALRLELSRSMVSRIESNERALTVELVSRIAEVLEMEERELLVMCLEVAYPELQMTKLSKTMKLIVEKAMENSNRTKSLRAPDEESK